MKNITSFETTQKRQRQYTSLYRMGVKINPSMGSKASMTGMLKMTCMLNSPNPQIGPCHQCYYYEILLNAYANIN
jgi:hypothetical protein